MASSTKRSWKLQEFVAHNANVNCLALGHKSGRVLATGGDDKKVNLWAVGKHNCIMSLSGHATPIECVRFNATEELVCAGSQTGTLKVWDLEAAKLIKTLNGHKAGISCLDFHPYGDFLASGSTDYSIKVWDTRRKGCIFSFKGHRSKVNSIKFSPDGQWIASSGEDSLVKVWDLRAGRLLHEFTNHTNSVTSVEFHPHEFLLASGGLDRTVHFWDLENFQLVCSEKDVGAVKCLWFNPDGECLFTGVTDSLKVLGWEPARMFDSLPIGWGKVFDIATAHNQLIGASFHLTNVQIFIADLKKTHPFGGPPLDIPTSPFSMGQSVRKSFSKERPPGLRTRSTIDVKTIEESASGTDPEEDFSADITNVKDYTEVFKPNRALCRTPPLVEPFKEPESDADPTEPQILSAPEEEFKPLSLSDVEITKTSTPTLFRYSPPDIKISQISHSPPELLNSPPHSLNSEPDNRITSSTPYSRSYSNLDQLYKSKLKTEHDVMNENNKIRRPIQLQRQYSCKDVPELHTNDNNNGIKHSASEANLNSNYNKNPRPPSRKNSFSKTPRNSNIPNMSRIPNPVPCKAEEHIKRPETKSVSKYSEDNLFKKPEPPKPLNLNRSDDYYKRPEPVDIYVSKTSVKSSPDEDTNQRDTISEASFWASRNRNRQRKTMDNSETPIRVRDRNHVVPAPSDRPVGLDLEEFLPTNLRSPGYDDRMKDMSEDEAIEGIIKDHESTMAVLMSRARALRVVHEQFRSAESKVAMEKVMNSSDLCSIHDVLKVLMHRATFWSLDMCVIILPKVHELLQSRFELHISTGCEAIQKTLKNFSSVIKTNMLAPVGSFSVDIPREERYNKCKKCYETLMQIRTSLKSRHLPGDLGKTITELQKDLERLCID